MSPSTTLLQRVWKIVIAAGALLGIVASLISIWTILRVDRLEHLVARAKHWKISIHLSEPQNGSETVGYIVRLRGNVDFRIAATHDESNPMINLSLSKEKVDIVPLVRPLSEAKYWWTQSSPVVRQDGTFEGSVFLGEKGGADIAIEFQVIALAVPKGSSLEGTKLTNLPFFYAASNTITVKRIR